MDLNNPINLSINTLDHKLIHGPLKIQVKNACRRLEEQSQRNDLLSQVLFVMLKAAESNYDAVKNLVLTSATFGTAAMIICRSTMDLVFSVCLILSDPQQYLYAYLKSGWREQFEEYKLLSQEEVNSSNQDWIKSFEDYLEFHSNIVGLSKDEKENITKIPYFPTPTQILYGTKRKNYLADLDDDTKRFLIKLNEGYYSGILSKIGHYSESGISWQAGPLLSIEYPDILKQLHISQPIAISMMILLCLLSEISIYFNWDNSSKLKELWYYMALSIPLQKQLYEIKYQKQL
jgi:hypothetical protein